jgi:hypothetical protein
VRIPDDCSLNWRKILKLRYCVGSFGNGSNVFLWWDNWHPLGPLIKISGMRLIHESGNKIAFYCKNL